MVSITTSRWKKMLFLAVVTANLGEFLTAGQCPADETKDWSYKGASNGPSMWGVKYPDCNGNNQSPIDINTTAVTPDPNLGPLQLTNNDMPVTMGTILNNGITVQMSPGDGVSRTISVGDQIYTLKEIHFHWGCDGENGSEHTIDGNRYTMEIHLTYENATGIQLVVGTFLQECGDNDELNKLTQQFKDVQYKDQTTDLTSSLDLSKLIPVTLTNYYRYDGSMTSPPCTENIVRIVVPDTMCVGTSQLQEFRKLYSVTQNDCGGATAICTCKICGNYRPAQDLNGRAVTCPASGQ